MAKNNPFRNTGNAPTSTDVAGTSLFRGRNMKVFEVNLIYKEEFVRAVIEGFIFDAKGPWFPKPHEKPNQAGHTKSCWVPLSAPLRCGGHMQGVHDRPIQLSSNEWTI
ncbi:hypothetical protein CDL15_Pgr007973 [Punica granatum]|uniref:Uncharacterized protein n=1 Tax=Punica granatum TaxID=22663 RepID=A0A218XAH2_PUNGR|nr:hypothetical protein CDL15_Pgr007973 [Punica granatum]